MPVVLIGNVVCIVFMGMTRMNGIDFGYSYKDCSSAWYAFKNGFYYFILF